MLWRKRSSLWIERYQEFRLVHVRVLDFFLQFTIFAHAVLFANHGSRLALSCSKGFGRPDDEGPSHEMQNPGRSRGFGFVVFEKEDDAKTAVSKTNESDWMGRIMRVNLAAQKSQGASRNFGDRPSGGGGGGGGRYRGGASRELLFCVPCHAPQDLTWGRGSCRLYFF